jgi:hypothetical protein
MLVDNRVAASAAKSFPSWQSVAAQLKRKTKRKEKNAETLDPGWT